MKTNKGFSLIEIIVGLSLMAVIGMGVTTIVVRGTKGQKQTSIKGMLESQKKIFESHMENSEVWRETIKANTLQNQPNEGLGCLNISNPNPQCDHNKVVNINVLHPNGLLLYESKVLTEGFTYNLESCNSFNSAGNDLCPFRWNVSVKLTCDTPQTTPPTPPPAQCEPENTHVTISGKFVYQPSDPGIFGSADSVNTANYSFHVFDGKGTRFFALEKALEKAKQDLATLRGKLGALNSALSVASNKLNTVKNQVNTLVNRFNGINAASRLSALNAFYIDNLKKAVADYTAATKSCSAERTAAVNAEKTRIITANCQTCCPP